MSPYRDIEKHNPGNILQSIVETAIDCIILIDATGTILMINGAGLKLFGYSIEELLGKNVTLLMPSPHKDIHHTYVNNYLNTGEKKIIGKGREVDGLRKDGTLFPARLAVSEIILDDTHFFTGIIHDMTDIKAVQNHILQLNHELEQLVIDRTIELQETVNLLLETNQQLNRSIEKHKTFEMALLATRDELRKSLEKEKELNTLKSRFVSMASHEFKTPLASILSSAALIARYENADQAADRARHVDRIKSSVTHLNNILMDFLSITRLEEGQFVPVISTFSLETVLNDLSTEADQMLKKGQKLKCQHELHQLEMQTDKNILRNILYNMISNAIKYSDEGKTIHCDVTSADKKVIIQIRDEGIGIPMADQKHIGSRFFRASNVINVPGTGLGLNIVIAYLHALNGELVFESQPGIGTTFIISLPIIHEK